MTAWYFVAPSLGAPPVVVKIGVLIWALALVPASLWLAPRIDSLLYDIYGESD